MKVAVIGSRTANGVDVKFILGYIPPECTEIVSGGTQGIDSLAEGAAAALSLPFTCIKPNYERFGRLAPLQRNIEIIEACDLVLAFWDMRSPGTKFVISECLKREKPLKIIRI